MRVLLVEDDDGDALIVEDELERSGAPVELHARAHARRGARDAASRASTARCSTSTCRTPTGLDGLRALREAAPDLAVLVLTGLDDERRGVEAVAGGRPGLPGQGPDERRRPAPLAPLRGRAPPRRARPAAALDRAARGARERAAGARPAARPAGSDAALALATHYRPGRRRALLGGDFYDAVQRPDGRVHAVIGDVCGHGPDEAALGVAPADRLAHARARAGARPDEVLAAPAGGPRPRAPRRRRLHDAVHGDARRPTARAPRSGCAGHPPPLLLDARRRARSWPRPLGPPLGVLDRRALAGAPVELPPEWSLLLYTDGVIEGRAPTGRSGWASDGLLRW